ncbi:MAG: hypothetical protein HYR77_00875 [Ignavibacteria bacterium]|nr:hypothetical protein [Ignavibacteria bacterium]
MQVLEFFRWNVAIIGIFVLIVILYLVGLINKRRREKFLHQQAQQNKHSNIPTHTGR